MYADDTHLTYAGDCVDNLQLYLNQIAYNLRDSENKLHVPLSTNHYKNSFSYSGATLWNSSPRDIRQAESLELFKRLIKEVS